MSMNLRCDEMPFIPQIGTWESELIFSRNEYGEPDGGAEGVVRRLIFWMRHQRQHRYNSLAYDPEAQVMHWERWGSLIQRVQTAAKNATVLHFEIR